MNIAAQNPIYLPQPPNGGSEIIKGLLIIGTIASVGYFGKKAFDKYQASKTNKEAGSDENVNIANQILAENESTVTNDSKIVELFQQIADYNKVKTAYSKISAGKDLLTHTKSGVSSSTYQEILNILGIKGGSKKPQTVTSKTLLNFNDASKPFWIISKEAVRVRKTPKKISALSLNSNTIKTTGVDEIVGFLDKAAIINNGRKLFYDSAEDIYFVPIKIKAGLKFKPAYVAASGIKFVESEKAPSNKWFQVTEQFYNGFKGVEKNQFNISLLV